MYTILFLFRVCGRLVHREIVSDDLDMARMIARRVCESPRATDISLWHGADRLTF